MDICRANLDYKWFCIVIIPFNLYISFHIVKLLTIRFSSMVNEAMGQRRKQKAAVISKAGAANNLFKPGWNRLAGRIYARAAVIARRSGFKHPKAASMVVFFRYLIPLMFSAGSFLLNFPDLIRSVMSGFLVYGVVSSVIEREKKKFGMKFQKNAYKIYKYLYNQISSGIKATDAIKTVHQVIDDKDLKGILVRMAGRYELTSDLDKSLEEFRESFDLHEVETLCTALKLGVDTGDNREMLARQEEIMFRKYFNYIQAETDSFKTRSLAAAVLFTVIIVVMITVPLMQEAGSSVDRIFAS